MTGKWLKILKALIQDPDLEWVFMDGNYIKAHQHSAGAAGEEGEAIESAAQAVPVRSTSLSMALVYWLLLNSPVGKLMMLPRPLP